jgi:DNA segregation ATPase FtsK/SpoIIIE, S-DNA-T family
MRLTFDLDDGSGSSRPISIDADEHATVGEVATTLANGLRLPDFRNACIRIIGRPAQQLHLDTPIAIADVRSGDRIELFSGTVGGRSGAVGAATAIIESGPETGRRIELGPGRHYVGRADKATVIIEDSLLSRVHFSINVGSEIEVADEGSTNGIQVDGFVVGEATILKPGQRVTAGATTLRVDRHAGGLAIAAKGSVPFNRPPRVWKPFVGAKISLPSGVGPKPKPRIPKIAAVLPIVMGGVMYLMTGRIQTIVFMFFGPLMMFGSAFENRRGSARDHKEDIKRFYEKLGKSETRLEDVSGLERASREREATGIGDLTVLAEQTNSRLWERSPDDDDFLNVRLGVADLPLRTSIEWQPTDRCLPELVLAGSKVVDRFAILPSAPVVVPLAEVRSLGLAGSQVETESMARSIVLQLATLHSPADLIITALLGPEMQQRWEWLMWLPHVRSAATPLTVNHLPAAQDEVYQLLDGVAQLVDKRGQKSKSSDSVPSRPAVLMLIDESVPIERNRLNWLFQMSQETGVVVVWMGSSVARMPKGCGAVADLPGGGKSGSVGRTVSGDRIENVRFEGVPEQHAVKLARVLAPIIDVSAGAAGGAALPQSVSLVEVLEQRELFRTPAAILANWSRSSSLTAKIGVAGTGAFAIDLRLDGPHMLIAGTTGAGKSELLQTLIASLAATHSPDRVTFLLVDYKGGSAFSTCVEFPHTVGLVTDLDTNQVRRALTSLRAELHYRERLLERFRCKDLIDLEKKHPQEAPPSLVLLVDEFAALAKEIPEFVEGVVNIAQRGRSLGIHLVLATQRPAGVITDNIKANTNLRIALRVSDSSESTDVIGSPVAAALSRSTPGRAVARVGPQELVTFQSAYVGGHSALDTADALISVADVGFGIFKPWPTMTETTVFLPSDPTDLRQLVDTTRAAFTSSNRPTPRRPWQLPLTTSIDLFQLSRAVDDTEIVFGLQDDPSHQAQHPAKWNPEKSGSLAIFGAGGSGKSTLLRTIAAAASSVTTGPPPEIYALDFAGRSMEALEDLPTVGAVIGSDEHERITRLLTKLNQIINTRTDQLAAIRAADVSSFRRLAPDADDQMPRIFVLLDGYQNFVTAYERIERGVWIDLIPKLIVSGRSVGIHFVLTADRRSAMSHTTYGIIPQRVVLRLANDDDYMNVGAPAKILGVASPEGRAIFDGLETQIAVAGGSTRADEQAIALGRLGRQLRRQRPGIEAAPILTLTEEVFRGDLAVELPGSFALSGTDLEPKQFTTESGAYLICGPMKSGKSSALMTCAEALRDLDVERPLFFLTGRPSPLDNRPVWDQSVVGIEQCAALLRQLAQELIENPQEVAPAVFIDDLHELHEGDVGKALSELLKVGKTNPVLLVATSDIFPARRASQYTPLGELKQFKRGLLLCPEVSQGDGDILGALLPNTSVKSWPPGRGYDIAAGATELVQVGIPS